MTITESCVLSGIQLTTEFPSHSDGEPVAYGFQTLTKGVTLKFSCKHYENLPPRLGFEP